MKTNFNIDTEKNAIACLKASEELRQLQKQLNKSDFEKTIDWISYKLFDSKSCMPDELKSFR